MSTASKRVKTQIRVILLVLVVMGLATVIVAKQGPTATDTAGSPEAAKPPVAGPVDGPSSSHADAGAAYEAALKSGKPVYVLFHSLTCEPCIEISAVVDKVVPAYEGKVVFVNAISDDPSSQRLASRFRFQDIPTSFFIDAKGDVVDSYTGVIDETSMKARLDKLAAP